MVVRIQICGPCAEGRCAACIDLHQPPESEGARRCVCRHSKAPRVARRAEPPAPMPTSAPFDLEAALGQAREEGWAAGYQDGFMAGAAEEAARWSDDPYQPEDGSPPPPAWLEPGALVLVELDPKGALVQVIAAGALEHVKGAAAAWEPALPGMYVEAWPIGSDDPITLEVGG